METLAGEIQDALSSTSRDLQVYGKQLQHCRETAAICATFPEGESQTSVRDAYCRNLLNSLLPDGFDTRSPTEIAQRFNGFWQLFGLEGADA